MSLEGLAAIGGLAFVLISSIAGGSYFMGGHARDLKSLKERQDKAEAKADQATKDIGDLKTGMATLTGKFDGLEQAVSTGFENMAALIVGRRSPRPRSKRPS